MDSSEAHAAGSGRRDFIDLALTVTGLAWLFSIVYPVVRFLKPLEATGPSGPTKLTPEQNAALTKDKFVIVPTSNKRLLVFVDPQQRVRALDARCTHEGCTVRYVADDDIVLCACHNARFDTDGKVLSGPPPKPLPKFKAQRLVDGSILVDTELT